MTCIVIVNPNRYPLIMLLIVTSLPFAWGAVGNACEIAPGLPRLIGAGTLKGVIRGPRATFVPARLTYDEAAEQKVVRTGSRKFLPTSDTVIISVPEVHPLLPHRLGRGWGQCNVVLRPSPHSLPARLWGFCNRLPLC